MRIGIVAPPDMVAEAICVGYDYVELNANAVRAMDADAYFAMTDAMRASGIRAEVLGGILPDDVRIIGRNVSSAEINRAMEGTLEMAHLLGADTLVFDCPALRCYPCGLDTAEVWRQLGNLIRRFQGWAATEDLRFAIMPMRRGVCGAIRHLSEAAMIPSLLGLDRVGIAASLYNMCMEADSPSELRSVRSQLMHVRISETITNTLPSPDDDFDYQNIPAILREIGYNGRLSVEGTFTDFRSQSMSARRIFLQSETSDSSEDIL